MKITSSFFKMKLIEIDGSLILKFFQRTEIEFFFILIYIEDQNQPFVENSNTHPKLVFTMVPGVGANSSKAYKVGVCNLEPPW